eukprot:CAMPEP_0174879270 /NCGR_PEP_ID=MMETSP1114-20130205/83176_1 /TAXON_ID=312471 /ORGANISM="Neobodo designis, Strain CCAP 1951/1" /LENGTH=494 /DNA_ID=CAMNT_0016114663 /DNA_START=56 /DNA_END=1541 /DNA_ORIENTATION=-
MASRSAAATALAALRAKKHTLYWNPLCPFVHRSLIVLEEKGAADVPERVFISLEEDAPEWYRKINPAETVPTLVVDGEPTLFESAFIAEYFDRIFGTPDQLFPAVAEVRAAIREFQDLGGNVIGALYGLLFSKTPEEARPKAEAAVKELEAALAARTAANGGPYFLGTQFSMAVPDLGGNVIGALYGLLFSKTPEEARPKAEAAVKELEAALAARTAANGGPYFLGTQFSMADVHIVPFLQRFSVTLPAFCDFDPLANAPALRRLRDAAALRPSVFGTSQTSVEYIKGYAGYTGKPLPLEAPKVRLPAGSPFGARVTVAAALAGIKVDAETVDPKTEVRVPSVTYAGTTARDSGKALEFLLDAHRDSNEASPPLVPFDAVKLGRAQFVAQEADTLGTAVVMSRKDGAGDEQRKELANAIKALEGLVAGPWAVGADVTFADATLVPHLARLGTDALADAPKLRALLDAALAKDGVKAALDAYGDDAAFNAFVASA